MRKDPGHQKISDTGWKESGGIITYLGEWHTHPVKTPSPSSTDRYEWSKLCAFYSDPLVFLIVGTERWYIELSGISWEILSPQF